MTRTEVCRTQRMTLEGRHFWRVELIGHHQNRPPAIQIMDDGGATGVNAVLIAGLRRNSDAAYALSRYCGPVLLIARRDRMPRPSASD